MTWDDFDAWAPTSVRGAAAHQSSAGLLPEPEAARWAAATFAALLPAGLATPLHSLFTVRPAETPARRLGHLWVRVRPTTAGVEAFVLDVELDPSARGQGWGRATLLAAEQVGRDQDATAVRLNVYAHSTAAVRLYTSTGYAATRATMSRRGTDAPEGRRSPGPRVALRPTTGARYAELRPGLVHDLAAEAVATGTPRSQAHRRTVDLLGSTPTGPDDGPGHRFWEVHDGDVPVAYAWLELRSLSDGTHAVLRDLEVTPERRGRGSGRAALDAVDAVARGRGCRRLEASAPAGDTVAVRLLEERGLQVRAWAMEKPC